MTKDKTAEVRGVEIPVLPGKTKGWTAAAKMQRILELQREGSSMPEGAEKNIAGLDLLAAMLDYVETVTGMDAKALENAYGDVPASEMSEILAEIISEASGKN